MKRICEPPAPLPVSLRAQAGMTLLFTLGFLSVLMVMMLSLAMVARTEQRSATITGDAVRTRLIAETAMERALAQLRVGTQGQLYPADSFIAPDDDSAWQGRRLLAGRALTGTDGDLTVGLGDAVASRVAGREATPTESPADKASWVPVYSQIQDDAQTRRVLIGRYMYLVLDESGRIDPGAVVRREQSEVSDEAVRLGYPVTDIALGDLGFSNPNAFNYKDADYPGQMPDVGRWYSLKHMIQGAGMTQEDVTLAARTLHPFSSDSEFFWRDRNGNGVWDVGEDSPRVNIVAEADPSVLYQQFVGAVQSFSVTLEDGSNAGSDDCAWLKQLDNSAWFRDWRDCVFADYAEPERTFRARATVAAQVAANIADYSDPDSKPTSVFIGSDGDLHLGTSSSSLTLHGIENNWGISEVKMRVQADIVLSEEERETEGEGQVPDAPEDIDFTVTTGTVVPQEDYEASVTILGVQLGVYNFSYNPPQFLYWCGVTADVVVGSEVLRPWGDYTDCYNNNVNDGNNPRNFDVPEIFPAGTPITVRSKYYWHHYYNSYTRRWEIRSNWYCFESLESDNDTQRVRVLRDGDPLPTITTVSNQNEAAYYLEDYVEDGHISLQPNQAIFLFETNTQSSSSGQDFQDLVVLVTLRRATPPARPEITTTYTLTGECNINPNNSADEFYVTKPDGSQITRDDLHKYGQDYTGPATVIHVKPKGNTNENSITLNGTNYPLRNGRTYTFTGDFNVHVYNDKYVNGKAMGHWWIGTEGQVAIVVDNGQIYAIEEEEEEEGTTGEETTTVVVPPETGADGMELGSTGSDLRVRAGFQVELFYPFGEDEQLEFAPESVTVQYTLQVATTNGKSLNYTGVLDALPTETENVDGGTLLWVPELANGEWLVIEDAFDRTQESGFDTYTVTMARIDSIVIHDRLGEVVDRVPSSNGPLCTWNAVSGSTEDGTFFANATCFDPLMNDRGQDWADFEMFWQVEPTDRTLAAGSETELGTMGDISSGYNSSPYSGIRAKNAPVERLGELGRIHSFRPNRSLRLWSASNGDTADHDAAILDLFKIGDAVQTRGKVNINTLQREVLEVLFKDCTTVSTSSAVDAVLAYRQNVGPFTNIGQVFGAIAPFTGSDATRDVAEEAAIASLAEKITVRQNYFRVLVCAQAVKDTAGIRHRNKDGDLVNSAYGQFDAAYAGDGTFLRNVDKVLAEEKLTAVVYRDAFSGKLRVEHVELLNE